MEGLESLLHERVRKHCCKLLKDGHPKHAALEAMTQVELALKERSGVHDKFGVALCTSLFGDGKGIKLRQPFGESYQRQAKKLFAGAFGYYRNYAAHDGSQIGHQTAVRILVLASELLDLIGASPVSFSDVGVEGLVGEGLFTGRRDLEEFLDFIDQQAIVDQVVDGLFENLAVRGKGEEHIEAVIETGLVEFRTTEFRAAGDPPLLNPDDPEEVSWFELTPLGRQVADGVPPNERMQPTS